MPKGSAEVDYSQGKARAKGLGKLTFLEDGTAGQIPIMGANGPAYGSVDDAISGIEDIHGEIAFPADGTYTIILDAKIARSILAVSVKTGVGTATVTPKINSTTLGGGANSATTSKSTVNHSTVNAMVVADSLTLVLSATSSDCVNLSFSIKMQRSMVK